MAIVIVTRNQYLLASKIHHITMTEQREYTDIRGSNGRFRSVKELSYNICVYYSSEVGNSNGLGNSLREDQRTCEITIFGKVEAYKVYADLIRQIREQNPDQLYLDKALEDLLTLHNAELKETLDSGARDYSNLETVASNDKSSARVRKARKTKRRNKKVLRKSKKRN